MSRAFDFVVAGVIYIISFVIHRVAIELFAPGTPLYGVAADGTGTLNGAARADLWSQILIVWIPLIAVVGITAWIFVREYRRQAPTTTVRGPAP